MPSKKTFIDLFCGAGGLSVGLVDSGWNPVAALDFDSHAVATYSKNHPGTPVLNADVSRVSGRDLLHSAGVDSVDLIAGGPSCQGFSTHGKRDSSDPRNYLFTQFARVVAEVRPRFVLIENVKGLLSYDRGAFKNAIVQRFSRLGYQIHAKVLCTADYGVPQLRHRVVFLGELDAKEAPSFPVATHASTESLPSLGISGCKAWESVWNAIGDLPAIGSQYGRSEWDYATVARTEFQRYARDGQPGCGVTLHRGAPLSALALSIAKMVKEGAGLRSLNAARLPERFRRMRVVGNGELRKDCTTLYHRLAKDRPSYTITCNFRNISSGPFLHPVENRSITVREAARLMSFRDSYEFVGAYLPRQVGNAVPPLFAKALGAAIADRMGTFLAARRRRIA